MKDLDTLEARFRADLRPALRRAASGRAATLFSLSENRVRSSARALRLQAQRIMELRQITAESPGWSAAVQYLTACLRWQHIHQGKPSAVREVAKQLLQE